MKLAVTSVLFILSIVSCTRHETANYRSRRTTSASTKETAENVVIEYTDSGILKAKVHSPLFVGMKQVKNPYIEMPKGVRVEFLKGGTLVESYLTSEYGISYTEKKIIIVRRNVEVLNIKGDTMQTEELIWDQNTGRIHTDKFVVIKTRTQNIWGDGMSSDQTFTDWEINNVRGTINKK